MNAHDYDEVTSRLAIHHGLALEDAERVIERLGITDTDDREYLYRHPEHLSGFDVDPQHHEHVDSLDAAIAAAKG